MKLISHRGNINGIVHKMENYPAFIDTALNAGYDVEIDLWLVGKQFYLGHDEPNHKISIDFLEERVNKLWIHCKNLDVLYNLSLERFGFNYFWHQHDEHSLTSHGIIWNYISSELTDRSICVLPELNQYKGDIKKCYGICSDFIENYKVVV